MCGFFAGVFAPEDAPCDERVEAALASIAHRGPDGRDWTRHELADGRVAILGHVRLALVGVEDGRQPFVGDGHATVVNGELYGWREERARLEGVGARFRTGSDSENVHHAYAKRGAGSWIEGLDGEWTAAVVDLTDGSLHAACDPFGTKPLRWWSSRDGRSFAVASEAKALFALGIRPELDLKALRFALSMQYLPLGATLFEGVSMLPPGHRLDHRDGRTTVAPWSDLALGMLADDAVDAKDGPALLEALDHAVSRRLPGERSFGTHLSGGLDSAIVTALAVRRSGRRIDAFVADFDFGPNETEQARATAAHVGARLIPVRIDEASLRDASDLAVRHSEGLSINGHAAAKIVLAKAVRSEGHRCVLTGEGADEAFWGYEHLRLDAGLTLHDDAATNTAGVHRPSGVVDGLEGLEEALHGRAPSFVRTKIGMTAPLKSAFGPALIDAPFHPAYMAAGLPEKWLRRMRTQSDAAMARALWNLHGLSGYILRGLDDAMGMSQGVESRLAFLDPIVQRAAATALPSEHFGSDGMEKALLRKAVAGLVPAQVLERRKAPFMSPMLTASPGSRPWLRERLLGGRLASSGLFEEDALSGLLDADATPALDAIRMTLCSLSSLMSEFEL
jgi:asparagine synthase (glutamine-hydrolysing)